METTEVSITRELDQNFGAEKKSAFGCRLPFVATLAKYLRRRESTFDRQQSVRNTGVVVEQV
jgi:hypothetical protein